MVRVLEEEGFVVSTGSAVGAGLQQEVQHQPVVAGNMVHLGIEAREEVDRPLRFHAADPRNL